VTWTTAAQSTAATYPQEALGKRRRTATALRVEFVTRKDAYMSFRENPFSYYRTSVTAFL
jgi:hypothetical protein